MHVTWIPCSTKPIWDVPTPYCFLMDLISISNLFIMISYQKWQLHIFRTCPSDKCQEIYMSCNLWFITCKCNFIPTWQNSCFIPVISPSFARWVVNHAWGHVTLHWKNKGAKMAPQRNDFHVHGHRRWYYSLKCIMQMLICFIFYFLLTVCGHPRSFYCCVTQWSALASKLPGPTHWLSKTLSARLGVNKNVYVTL